MMFRSTLLLGALLLAAPIAAQDAPEPPLTPPTVTPERIVLNLAADPAHAMAVTWRSAPGLQGFVELAEAGDGPDFVKSATRLPAQDDDATIAVRETPTLHAAYHSLTMTGLKPDTVYAYRVGNGTHWSEWLQFRTAAVTPRPFRFLFLGDMQNQILSEASRTLRMGLRMAGDAAFVLHGGDLINRHDSDAEWGEWFAAGGYAYGQTPQMPTPGNHEYGRGPVLNPQWQRQFTLPANGPAGIARLADTCWSTDYQGVRLISIDAPQLHGVPESRAAMVAWLEPLLAHNPNRWTVLLLHFPLYSLEPQRDNDRVRDALKPLIDKYKVDLVLQGHDHGYGRGTIGPVGPGKGGKGATYVVAVAGPKMYDGGIHGWPEKSATNTQTFQVIDVTDRAMTYRAYTAAGRLLDETVLRK